MTGKGPEELGFAFPIMPKKSREFLWVYSRLEVGRIWLGMLKLFVQTIIIPTIVLMTLFKGLPGRDNKCWVKWQP